MSDAKDPLSIETDRKKSWIEYCMSLFPAFRNLTKEEIEAHKNYIYDLFESQEDSDPKIQEVVNNHFWELFED